MNLRANVFNEFNLKQKSFSSLLANLIVEEEAKEKKLKS
jgi:hypothetical protein